MNKTIVTIGIAAIVVLGGAATWYFTRDDSGSTEKSSSNSQASNASASGDTSVPVFHPQPMDNVDYVATFKTTGKNGETGTGVYEHSANGDYKISGSSQGQTYEMYSIAGGMISCSNGECIRIPGDIPAAPVNSDSIGYNKDDADSNPQVKPAGKEACSVGMCDKWEVVDLSKNGKITYYTQGDRMYRMIAETDDGTMDGSYEYKKVSIQEPANVRSL